MDKALTAGYSGGDAPATRTGVAAKQKEALDPKVKVITWTNDDNKRLKMKKKKKKLTKSLLEEVKGHLQKIIKLKKEGKTEDIISHHEEIDKLLHDFVGEEGLTAKEKKKKGTKKVVSKFKKDFPEYSNEQILKAITDDIEEKQKRKQNKELFKSILKQTHKCYPGISYDEIVYIATEVYKKRLGRSD